MVDLRSYVPSKAAKDDTAQLDYFRMNMENASRTVPILSKYWTNGEFKLSRQIVPMETTDIDHGAVNILAETPARAFSLLFNNPDVKKEQLEDLAEKTANDLVTANSN